MGAQIRSLEESARSGQPSRLKVMLILGSAWLAVGLLLGVTVLLAGSST